MKRRGIKKFLMIIVLTVGLIIPLITYYPAAAVKQGTDGLEMKVMEPEQLEIQLGTDWTGVEFQLKTDAGLYPGTITVGEDGVLRTEIGGSKRYILTCLHTNISTGTLDQTIAAQKLPREETQEVISESGEQKKEEEAQKELSKGTENEKNIATGVPVKHIVLFSVGMVIAVGSLLVMHFLQKQKNKQNRYDEEDDVSE